MANAKHTSPDGKLRFEVIARVNHVFFLLGRRDHAGVRIVREVEQGTGFLGRKKFVRAGNARAIVASISYQDESGDDIGDRIGISETSGEGVFASSSDFASGLPIPDNLGNDARSVRKLQVVYRLPFEQTDRTLTAT